MLPENQSCLHKITIDARDCLADNQIKPVNFLRLFINNQSKFFRGSQIFQHCCRKIFYCSDRITTSAALSGCRYFAARVEISSTEIAAKSFWMVRGHSNCLG